MLTYPLKSRIDYSKANLCMFHFLHCHNHLLTEGLLNLMYLFYDLYRKSLMHLSH